jgi:hypothetical protein
LDKESGSLEVVESRRRHVDQWLFGAVPYLFVLGVVAAVSGIAHSKNRRMAFKISVASFALAGMAFVLSVTIGSMNSMPT